MANQVSVDQLAGVYIKIRDAKSTLKKEFDAKYAKLDEQQDRIKAALLKYCKEQELESFRTAHGTVARKVTTRYWTSDWPSMYKFVLDNQLPEFFEKRLNQTSVREYLADNPEAVPPGLNADASYTISVSKPRKPRQKAAE